MYKPSINKYVSKSSGVVGEGGERDTQPRNASKACSLTALAAQELRTPPVESKPIVKSAGTSPDSEQENQKKAFHRSVSEYGSEEELVEHEFVLHRAVSVSSRRRNNSGGVSGVLCFPPTLPGVVVFPPVANS